MDNTTFIRQMIKAGVTPEDFTTEYKKEKARQAEAIKNKKRIEEEREKLVSSLKSYLSKLTPEDNDLNDKTIKAFEQELKEVEELAEGGYAKIHFKIDDGKDKKEFNKEGSVSDVDREFLNWFMNI